MKAGQFIAYMGDSGNAEGTQPHLHFEIHRPDDTPINPYTSLRLAQGLPADGLCSLPSNPTPDPSNKGGHAATGRWAAGQRDAASAPRKLSPPATGRARPATRRRDRGDRDGQGLLARRRRTVASDAFGDAESYGATGRHNFHAPIITWRPTPSGKGYWLVGPTAASSPSATRSSTARPAASA